ncbi:MAG: translation initiation factor IF-2 [Acidimicrobiales bacterium]|nr:translation initiation factor IF-2 [Acidimicrobiales bacterium]
MAKSVRVYELARQLGMTNAEVIKLCGSLGVDVKSHSSGMVEAQADRVRRKAESEGLTSEPKEEKTPPKKKKTEKISSKKTVSKSSGTDIKSKEKTDDVPQMEAETVDKKNKETKKETEPKRVISSSGSSSSPQLDVEEPQELDQTAIAEPPVEKTEKVEAKSKEEDKSKKQKGPVSASGKKIPPPPGSPKSLSGKPIPPPPGAVKSKQKTKPDGASPAPGRRSTPPPMSDTKRPSQRGEGRKTSTPGTGQGQGDPRSTSPLSAGKPGEQKRGPGSGARRRPKKKSRKRRTTEELQPMDAPPLTLTPEDAAVPEGVILLERQSTAQEIAPKLNRTSADVIRFLMEQGEMVTATQTLSDDMIELFAAEIGAEVSLIDQGEEQEVELLALLEIDEEEIPEDAPGRPPIITVMGHVDHGKTKLLDQIRNAKVADGEAGGITQHIGAYQIVKNGSILTFIDTPGHEAFTTMRARGAESTDLVVLVVAADDGVMPQTLEAINHARAAEVPIVVAINKIDRENADIQKVMGQLAENNLVPESWGGETVTVEISALENLGIDELLENLTVVAEVEDLRAEPDARARGVVLESNLDAGKGPVATVLVQNGTLRVGEPVVAGASWGRVRALINDTGEQVKEAGPSTPVQLLGLNEVADAGDEIMVAPTERLASRVAERRSHHRRQTGLGRDAHALSGGARLEDIFEQIQKGEAANLNLVVKADMHGSLEAVSESLRKLEREDVKLSFVHRGVGRISENDIQLASTTNATIIGFNVRPERKARDLAGEEHVEIRSYEVIYELIGDIEAAMLGLLAPEYEEIVTGDAEVREIFSVPKIGKIAGCYATNGTIARGSKVRFLREGAIIWKGEVSSLRRFKDDVKEVQAGFECGIGLSDFQDLKAGDVIETYEEREIART